MMFFTALFPIALTIAIGYGLHRTAFLDDTAWRGIEKLTYYLLLPALLIRAIGTQELDVQALPVTVLVVLGTLLVAIAACLAWLLMRRDFGNATKTSVFQGGVRFNTYIALAVALALLGDAGLAAASVAAGFLIIGVNLACIAVFVVWGVRPDGSPLSVGRELMLNPLILGCLIGWIMNLVPVAPPAGLLGLLEVLGRGALPLGLLAVGAALRPRAMPGHGRAMAVATVVQFVIKPLAAVTLLASTGATGVGAAALLILFATPTAPSAYILARQLGGDTETMASIITVQTLLAFAAMPALVALGLGFLGIDLPAG